MRKQTDAPLVPFKGGGLSRLARGDEKEYYEHYRRQGVILKRKYCAT